MPIAAFIVGSDIPEWFIYEVTLSEEKRIKRYFGDRDAGRWTKDFIVFDSSDRRFVVVLRGSEAQYLGRRTNSAQPVSLGPFPFHAKFFLRHGAGPLLANITEPPDASWLVTALDSEPASIELFWPVINSAGDLSAISAGEMMLVEVDADIVNQGLARLDRMLNKPGRRHGHRPSLRY